MMVSAVCDQLTHHAIGMIEHDTVPGIVSLMTHENAQKIQRIKQRDVSKGFIVLIPNMGHLGALVDDVSPMAWRLIHAYWPGPLTIIFRKNPRVSPIITGHRDTIAVRYPRHWLLSTVLRQVNRPLISTSANMSGQNEDVRTMAERVDVSLGDFKGSSTGVPSTIVSVVTDPPTVLRQGAITISGRYFCK